MANLVFLASSASPLPNRFMYRISWTSTDDESNDPSHSFSNSPACLLWLFTERCIIDRTSPSLKFNLESLESRNMMSFLLFLWSRLDRPLSVWKFQTTHKAFNGRQKVFASWSFVWSCPSSGQKSFETILKGFQKSNFTRIETVYFSSHSMPHLGRLKRIHFDAYGPHFSLYNRLAESSRTWCSFPQETIGKVLSPFSKKVVLKQIERI